MLTGIHMSCAPHSTATRNVQYSHVHHTVHPRALFCTVMRTILYCWASNPRPTTLCHAVGVHICKLYVYCKYGRFNCGGQVSLTVIFICIAHETAHNSGCGASRKKGWKPLLYSLAHYAVESAHQTVVRHTMLYTRAHHAAHPNHRIWCNGQTQGGWKVNNRVHNV